MQTTIAPPTPSLVSLTWFLKFVNKCVRPFPYLPQPRTYIDCVVRSIKKQFTKTAPTRITWLIELGVARSPIIKCFYKHLSCGRSSKEWWGGGEMSSTSYIPPPPWKKVHPPLLIPTWYIYVVCVYEGGRTERETVETFACFDFVLFCVHWWPRVFDMNSEKVHISDHQTRKRQSCVSWSSSSYPILRILLLVYDISYIFLIIN